MPDDETPVPPALQQALLAGAYAELYPSLRGRLKAILASDDPALKAKVAAFAAMAGRRGRHRRADRRHRLDRRPGRGAGVGRLLRRQGRGGCLDGGDGAGGAVADYAALYSVAEGTARTHLKAVFAKTGAHRQSDLVRLLAASDR